MRTGKLQTTTAALVAGIATPDNSNYVILYFESDSSKLCVKKSDASVVRSAALA